MGLPYEILARQTSISTSTLSSTGCPQAIQAASAPALLGNTPFGARQQITENLYGEHASGEVEEDALTRVQDL